MFENEVKIRKRIEYIESELKKYEQMGKSFPEGEIIVARNNNAYKWYVKYDGKTNYLSKKQKDLARQLALKKYYQYKTEELELELRACQEYIGFAEMARNKTEQMMTHDEYVRLLDGQFCSASKELKKWMEEDFETNNDHPETRNIKATQGRFVRSKSEAIIDKLLYSYGIPFRYEQKLVLGNTTIHPDFTIRHPRNGKIYYWEHMGMMDNPDYIANACNKIKLYCRNGIVPSVNLILTYETKESPLDIETIEQMIKEYFV